MDAHCYVRVVGLCMHCTHASDRIHAYNGRCAWPDVRTREKEMGKIKAGAGVGRECRW